MTPEELKAAAAVMLAAAEGESIQYQKRGAAIWTTSENNNISWDWWSFNYRVKPETCVPYRRYLYFTGTRTVLVTTQDDSHVQAIESGAHFVRWIDTEWQTHEV